ncbi:MAG: diguanylate cyclase, partial [Oscillospiraceae bacterium]|nr:diguanylate cyclase [Oscillospiraceae bacterium]
MRRRNKILILAAAYIAAALAALNIALRIPEHMALILIVFAAMAVVSVLFLTLGMKYLNREHAIRERERLSEIMHSLNAMVILWDDDFRYVEVNDELTKSIGYTSEDLADIKNLQKVLPPDAFAPSLQAIVNNRDEEFYVTAKGGAKVCTIWNTSIMSTVHSKTRTKCLMMSIGMDISETVRMKEDLIRYSKDLAESESRYSMSMELSEIGIVLKKPDKNTFYVSEQLCGKLGFEKGDNIPAETLREFFHEDDKKIFDALAASMTSIHSANNNEIHNSEFRVLEADGQYHWFNFRYKITPNVDINYANIGGAVIDVTKDKAKDTLIEKMAYIDDVTQIFNRNKFMQIGQETFECASVDGAGISYWVIVLDIDNFHLINDTCGYANGNKLLNEFGQVVEKSLTAGGFGARIGGDNFALLIHDTGDDELPVSIIKNIQEQLKGLCDDSFAAQTVTCSAGYCKMSDGGSDFAQVLDHAEFSLSMSDGTKNDIIRYDNKIHDKIIEGNVIESELTKAIENHELALYYQPKIDLSDGTLMGMEALIRWIKPDGTVVPPNKFIPVAENSLLITKIS